MVKNLPCTAGDVGSILSRGTKIPHAAEQLSPAQQLLSPCAPEPKCQQLRSINVKYMNNLFIKVFKERFSKGGKQNSTAGSKKKHSSI